MSETAETTEPEVVDPPEEAEKATRKPRAAKPAERKVSVGRIVHYVTSHNVGARLNTVEGKHCAGIVTEVDDETGTISLRVYSPALNNPLNITMVSEDAECGTHSWHWPETV